jgi:3-phenylpropionate/trans-cinnamate dioxygenase ferredoxin reductase subunit
VRSGPAIVIVGASLAGATAAATLRGEGYDGRLVVIGDEEVPPYERPPLSKTYLRGEQPLEGLFVRPPDFWEDHGIELLAGQRAEALDAHARTVTLAGGTSIRFDRALVATGVRNRRLDVPGSDLDGVVQLRTIADADRIRASAASSAKVVVVGFGFIGAEVTASLRMLGVDVEVVEIFHTAMARVLGGTLGPVLESLHRDRGVRFHFGDAVERFEGAGRVERVVTRTGVTIECGGVVVGIGTEPNVEVMPDAVAANGGGGIEVGPTLEPAIDGVFAAGDVATHEHPLFGPIRVEHFDNALKMGEHAARNLLGAGAVFDDPHWFWSDQYEHEIQMAGVVPQVDDSTMVVRGSLDDRRFCAFLLDDAGVLRGAISLDWPRDCRRSLKLIAAQAAPPAEALADPDVDLRGFLSRRGEPRRP